MLIMHMYRAETQLDVQLRDGDNRRLYKNQYTFILRPMI